MNFLAHLVLCEKNAESRLGSLLPDLMRVPPGKGSGGLSEEVLRAVEQHRRVDRATDAHPAFIACREALGGELGRYSGVCVDVFFDYVLSRRWAEYVDEDREAFIASVYRDISSLGDRLPVPVAGPLARMVEEDWLGAYATIPGMRRVFGRMSMRLSARFERVVEMEPMADVLERRYEEVERAFCAVFEDVRRGEERCKR
jgi:acyl carrier protein phosphodiesterase